MFENSIAWHAYNIIIYIFYIISTLHCSILYAFLFFAKLWSFLASLSNYLLCLAVLRRTKTEIECNLNVNVESPRSSVSIALSLATPEMTITRNLSGAVCCLLLLLVVRVSSTKNSTEDREGKYLSVFNVVSFPNDACGATNGFNGTCYTSSECKTLGGTASGTCASSFGVCCVFSIACGGSSSANNSYAIISSYSTSTDTDPCTYTFCPTSSDICKLRIDFDTMVLTAPSGVSSTSAAADSITVGDCTVDTLTVSNPGGSTPPTICGYNTGQHMFVPASTQCNQINIDIDTGTTTTTRKWQIKVTQYECGNLMAPEQDCLQYHTASSGQENLKKPTLHIMIYS